MSECKSAEAYHWCTRFSVINILRCVVLVDEYLSQVPGSLRLPASVQGEYAYECKLNCPELNSFHGRST